jgi:hypothetical protein
MVELCLFDRLIGRRYGLLTVESLTCEQNKFGCFLLQCRCDCGATVLEIKSNLNAGKKKSCGCLAAKFTDLTGLKVGRLTVVEVIPGLDAHGKRRWRCQCDCGEFSSVIASFLTGQKKTLSCGCLIRDGARARAIERNKSNPATWKRWGLSCPAKMHWDALILDYVRSRWICSRSEIVQDVGNGSRKVERYIRTLVRDGKLVMTMTGNAEAKHLYSIVDRVQNNE